jgi:hypothetical protein
MTLSKLKKEDLINVWPYEVIGFTNSLAKE